MQLRIWPSFSAGRALWRASLGLVATLFTLACKPEAATHADLLVAVRTDYLAGEEFTRIVVNVSGKNDPISRDACEGAQCTSFEQPRVVATFEKLPVSSGRRVEVSLLDPSGKVVAKDSGVLAHDRRTAMVLWLTRTCEGVSCEDGLRCLGGQCVDARCTDGTQVECGGSANRCDRASDCPAIQCGEPRCERGVCTPDVIDACDEGQRCEPALGCLDDDAPVDGSDGDAGEMQTDGDGGDDPNPPVNNFPNLVPELTSYTSQFNVDYVTYAWIGNEVALLTLDDNYDPEVVGRILTVYDDAYKFFKRVTGREPARFKSLAGRSIIAFLDSTCQPGFCVRVGQTGIDLLASDFDRLYDGVAAGDTFDASLLEQVALNFWFYENKIGYLNSDVMAFGFAICSALDGLEEVGPTVMRRGGQDLATFRAILEQFVDTYVELGAPFESTLAVGTAPTNTNQLGGGALVCSMIRRLEARHGAGYTAKLWQQIDSLPDASTNQAVSEGFMVAASRAAQADLSSVIADRWGFVVSEQARSLARTAGAAVDPSTY